MGYTALAVRELARDVWVDRGPARDSEQPRATDPHVDPGSPPAIDPSEVEDLGDEIATLAAHIHAGTHRLLELLARFDRLCGWEAGGHRSCAHWLAFRTGLDLGTAREHVRVARALAELPLTGAAMARGELAFSQVRALTRVAETETEADLVKLASGCTTAQLERLVRAWKRGGREDEAALERERHRSRALSVFPDDDGMYVVNGRLDPEVGALLMRAVEAASDALYRKSRPLPVGASWEETRAALREGGEREAARHRADALGLVAERALVAGFGRRERAPESPEHGADDETPISGTRAERYQVVLYVDSDTLAADGEPDRSELEDGTRVSAETSRRLACDASLVRLRAARPAGEGANVALAAGHVSGREERVLDVGRRTRTIPTALRRALEARDRGCRFPGCGLRFTDAHHVIHWADGGATSLANTVLLCRHHHRLVHEGGWKVEWWAPGQPAFRDPRGVVHAPGRLRSPPRLPARPVAALARLNRLRGADPGAWTASARWRREADIPDPILFRALEAAL